MSGPALNGYTTFRSPHGAIGEHIPGPSSVHADQHQPQQQQFDMNLGMNALNLHGSHALAHDTPTSRASRDTSDILSMPRRPFDPTHSIWSKNDTNHLGTGGWDRASANHFASRPTSPQKASLLVPEAATAIKSAPNTASPYTAFNPVITPPVPPAALPSHKSPSPPRHAQTQEREVVIQAAHHMQQLQALVGPMVAQLEDVDKLKAELAMWKNSCEAASVEVNRLQSQLQLQSDPVETGPSFSAVLIDGDSLIFHDRHLKAGPQGGQAAAQALLNLVASSDEALSSTTTIQVFLNKNGLGNSLIKAGSVSSWSVFEGFWQGFSAQHGLISVIDVGPAKEAAQAKLTEHLRLCADQRQCLQIFVGSNKPIDSVVSDKVTLVKSRPDSSQPDIRVLPDIFRSEPLPIAPISFSSVVSSAPQTPLKPVAAPAQPAPSARAVELETSSSSEVKSQSEDLEVEVYEWEEAPKDNIEEWTEARKKPHKKVNGKAAGAAGPAGSKKPAASTVAEFKDIGKKDKMKKRGGPPKHRKDYGVRDMKPRPCHSYYLSPAGCRNDVCHYGHEYDLDDDQLNELATLAKQIPCPFAKGNRCHFDDDTCIYGHKCPRGNSCTFEECRFDDIDPDHQDWS